MGERQARRPGRSRGADGSQETGEPAPILTRAALRKTFDLHLERHGLKSTRQRAAILDVFLASQEHLTGEEIHRRVVRRHPEIGFSTVYRTLRLFVAANIASERHFRDGVARYEVRQPHHDHLVCLRCGRIVEFQCEAIESLQEEVAEDHGFVLVSHRHELYGTCRACARSGG
jgi:Fur family ferric uptake transcriptional regulator